MTVKQTPTCFTASETKCSAQRISPTLSVLIVGLGNMLLSDEGIGIKVVESLKTQYDFPETIEVIDGGTMGMELLPYFEAKSHIIIIDAVKTGLPPGTVTKIEDLPAFFRNRISPHQIGITDVLALAELSENSKPNIVLFGIEPGRMDTGMELSPEVSSKINFLVDKVIEELRLLGFELEPKAIPAMNRPFS